MKRALFLKSLQRWFTLAIITVSVIIGSSFNIKKSNCNKLAEQFHSCDTLPYTSPRIFKWGQIPQLIPFNGELIVFDGKDSLLIKRKEYEAYARELQDEIKYDNIFTKLEIEAEYPGGPKAWRDYVNKNLNYPKDAQDTYKSTTVIVLFIVDTNGKIRDLQAISGPVTGGLKEEAIRLVRASGTWHPGIQNFGLVTSYKKQPVTFIIN